MLIFFVHLWNHYLYASIDNIFINFFKGHLRHFLWLMFLNFSYNFIAVDIRRLGVPKHPQNFEVQKSRVGNYLPYRKDVRKRNGQSINIGFPGFEKLTMTVTLLHSMDKKQTFSKIKLIYLWPTWNTFKLKIFIMIRNIFDAKIHIFFASIKHKLKVVLTLFLDTLSSMAEPGTGWWCCFSTGELLLRRAFTQHGQANQPL